MSNDDENAARSALLGRYRGWRNDDKPLLFREWPAGLTWSFVTFERADLAHCHYGNTDPWSTFTHQSLLIPACADRINSQGGSSLPGDVINAINGIAQGMQDDGTAFVPVVAMGTSDASVIVMVEGWKRMTAFAMVETRRELKGIYASGPLSTVQTWNFFPPQLR